MGIFGREMGGGRLPVTVYAVLEGISVGALGYRPFSLVLHCANNSDIVLDICVRCAPAKRRRSGSYG